MILGRDDFNSIRRRWARAIAWGLLGVTIYCEVLAQISCSAAAAAGTNQNAPDSGISGAMVAAWGNPPANPPTYHASRFSTQLAGTLLLPESAQVSGHLFASRFRRAVIWSMKATSNPLPDPPKPRPAAYPCRSPQDGGLTSGPNHPQVPFRNHSLATNRRRLLVP